MRSFVPLLLLVALVPVPTRSSATHAFEREPVNGLGVRALEDLRGRPVLVEFWGTR